MLNRFLWSIYNRKNILQVRCAHKRTPGSVFYLMQLYQNLKNKIVIIIIMPNIYPVLIVNRPIYLLKRHPTLWLCQLKLVCYACLAFDGILSLASHVHSHARQSKDNKKWIKKLVSKETGAVSVGSETT